MNTVARREGNFGPERARRDEVDDFFSLVAEIVPPLFYVCSLGIREPAQWQKVGTNISKVEHQDGVACRPV